MKIFQNKSKFSLFKNPMYFRWGKNQNCTKKVKNIKKKLKKFKIKRKYFKILQKITK